ncbi:hypothetical protein ACJX0J_006145, partial [Zea mays]
NDMIELRTVVRWMGSEKPEQRLKQNYMFLRTIHLRIFGNDIHLHSNKSIDVFVVKVLRCKLSLYSLFSYLLMMINDAWRVVVAISFNHHHFGQDEDRKPERKRLY